MLCELLVNTIYMYVCYWWKIYKTMLTYNDDNNLELPCDHYHKSTLLETWNVSYCFPFFKYYFLFEYYLVFTQYFVCVSSFCHFTLSEWKTTIVFIINIIIYKDQFWLVWLLLSYLVVKETTKNNLVPVPSSFWV